MRQVPLQPAPSQQTQIVLDNQTCEISVYVKNQCIFFDLAVNGVAIAYSIQAKNLVSLVPTMYLGFTGWLVFYDTQGTDDPLYTGLGTRWQLLYLDQGDMTAYGIA